MLPADGGGLDFGAISKMFAVAILCKLFLMETHTTDFMYKVVTVN